MSMKIPKVQEQPKKWIAVVVIAMSVCSLMVCSLFLRFFFIIKQFSALISAHK